MNNMIETNNKLSNKSTLDNFDFAKLYYKDKVANIKKFQNVKFKINNYTIFIDDFSGIGEDVASSSYIEHYIIEMNNSDKQKGLFEISMKDSWNSIKNHLEIGTLVNASGSYYYDENEILIYIEIDNFNYNDIIFSKNNIFSKTGEISITRKINENKYIKTMLIVWFVSLILMKISIKIFGLLFLIDTIGMIIYVTIANKKIGMKSDELLEKSGLKKIEQQYRKISNRNGF